MRILLTARVVLLGVVLAAPFMEAGSPKSQCKDRCHTQYDFCLKRSTTKKGRSSCKVELKNCRGACR